MKKSVAVMKKQLQGLYRAFGASMFSLVMAGVMMAWVKMGQVMGCDLMTRGKM